MCASSHLAKICLKVYDGCVCLWYLAGIQFYGSPDFHELLHSLYLVVAQPEDGSLVRGQWAAALQRDKSQMCLGKI